MVNDVQEWAADLSRGGIAYSNEDDIISAIRNHSVFSGKNITSIKQHGYGTGNYKLYLVKVENPRKKFGYNTYAVDVRLFTKYTDMSFANITGKFYIIKIGKLSGHNASMYVGNAFGSGIKVVWSNPQVKL